MTEITLEETETKGRYVYQEAGRPEAEMTFSKAGEHMLIIDHTGVPEAYKGEGVGRRLVTRAVEDARKNKKKILPLCPFAAAEFRKHPDWADVLSK
ncbi:MAG: GNAT family N-acetyltransferase [Hyphomicrobiales bacterium]|nr:MAG: GNAT family N-acetyltransferase [Hyphomicrobiales bacterium]